jgi:hypothetical protein
MPANTNDGSIPARTNPEAISGNDVDTFVEVFGVLARDLPVKQQALLHLVLATAASAGNPDISEFLTGFPIPNPRDVIVAASGASTGSQTDAVVAPSAEAIEGDLPDRQAAGAAGGALARALLNIWGEPAPREPAGGRGVARDRARGGR